MGIWSVWPDPDPSLATNFLRHSGYRCPPRILNPNPNPNPDTDMHAADSQHAERSGRPIPFRFLFLRRQGRSEGGGCESVALGRCGEDARGGTEE